MEISRSAIIELAYNTVGMNVNNLQQQYDISNIEMELILSKVLKDVQSTRLIEASNDIMMLTNKINDLEQKGVTDDKPDDQS